MVRLAIRFNSLEGATLIIKDVGQDGKADEPELKEFLEEASKVAPAALV